MAKFTREDDDDRDEPARPAKLGGAGAVVVILLAAGGVLTLLVVAGGLALFWFAARTSDREAQEVRVQAEAVRAEARAAEVDKPVRTRDEWTKLLVGKTRDEVTELAGKPDRTSDDPLWTWSYDRRSSDPVSGETDPTMTVWFRGADGTVEKLSY